MGYYKDRQKLKTSKIIRIIVKKAAILHEPLLLLRQFIQL